MSDTIQRIEYRSGLASFSGETEIVVLNSGAVNISFKRGKEVRQFNGEIAANEKKGLFKLANQVLAIALATPEKLVPDSSPTSLTIETENKVHEWHFAANQKFSEKKMLALIKELEKTSDLISKGEVKF